MNDGNDGMGVGDGTGLDGDDLDRLDEDGLIEQSLRSYTPREPRAGLESRVLSHVAAAEAERSWRGWGWKLALAAAMALLAVVLAPVGYRLLRQDTAVVQSPEVRLPAVGEARQIAQAAPLLARTDRHTMQHRFTRPFPARGGVAGAESVGMKIAANRIPRAMERATVAPIDDKGPADELATLKPITLKPITIAPIQIGALN
jgi:hypothetical protein